MDIQNGYILSNTELWTITAKFVIVCKGGLHTKDISSKNS